MLTIQRLYPTGRKAPRIVYVALLLVATLLIVALNAVLPVSAVPAGGHTATPGPADTSTPGEFPGTAEDATVLFRDTFDTYSNRWVEVESFKASAAYRDFAMNLRVVSPGVSVWSVPDFALPLKYYTITANVTFNQGSPDSLFGFVLDYQDNDNFLALAVAIDGTWEFGRYVDGVWQDMTPPGTSPVPVMESLKTMVLGVEVTAEELTLLIDGERIAAIELGESLRGNVFGVIAHAGRGYVDVSFDDVVVLENPLGEGDGL